MLNDEGLVVPGYPTASHSNVSDHLEELGPANLFES
jgi:hypothetical protein